MTEQELRRTAVIIPPTGRAVLCVWAAVPGLFAAPFVFWQSIVAGAGFCLLWGVITFQMQQHHVFLWASVGYFHFFLLFSQV